MARRKKRRGSTKRRCVKGRRRRSGVHRYKRRLAKTLKRGWKGSTHHFVASRGFGGSDYRFSESNFADALRIYHLKESDIRPAPRHLADGVHLDHDSKARRKNGYDFDVGTSFALLYSL